MQCKHNGLKARVFGDGFVEHNIVGKQLRYDVVIERDAVEIAGMVADGQYALLFHCGCAR